MGLWPLERAGPSGGQAHCLGDARGAPPDPSPPVRAPREVCPGTSPHTRTAPAMYNPSRTLGCPKPPLGGHCPDPTPGQTRRRNPPTIVHASQKRPPHSQLPTAGCGTQQDRLQRQRPPGAIRRQEGAGISTASGGGGGGPPGARPGTGRARGPGEGFAPKPVRAAELRSHLSVHLSIRHGNGSPPGPGTPS